MKPPAFVKAGTLMGLAILSPLPVGGGLTPNTALALADVRQEARRADRQQDRRADRDGPQALGPSRTS